MQKGQEMLKKRNSIIVVLECGVSPSNVKRNKNQNVSQTYFIEHHPLKLLSLCT